MESVKVVSCEGGWCGRGQRPRTFHKREPVEWQVKEKYEKADFRIAALCGSTFLTLNEEPYIWDMKKGDLARISLVNKAQVGTLNLWSTLNPKEHFSSGITRVKEGTHMAEGNRLWSNNGRIMSALVFNSIKYESDTHGAALHDIILPLCNSSTAKTTSHSCQNQIISNLKSTGREDWIPHDGVNMFLCSGFKKDTKGYFTKPSPAGTKDYIDIVAEIDLTASISVCPIGDGGKTFEDAGAPEKHPFAVTVYRPH